VGSVSGLSVSCGGIVCSIPPRTHVSAFQLAVDVSFGFAFPRPVCSQLACSQGGFGRASSVSVLIHVPAPLQAGYSRCQVGLPVWAGLVVLLCDVRTRLWRHTLSATREAGFVNSGGVAAGLGAHCPALCIERFCAGEV
jgi:hypothetical protein